MNERRSYELLAKKRPDQDLNSIPHISPDPIVVCIHNQYLKQRYSTPLFYAFLYSPPHIPPKASTNYKRDNGR